MDRSYRQEINLLLLQTFGLGATRVGSGRLESIPTNFNLSDWPTPNEPTTPSTPPRVRIVVASIDQSRGRR